MRKIAFNISIYSFLLGLAIGSIGVYLKLNGHNGSEWLLRISLYCEGVFALGLLWMFINYQVTPKAHNNR